MMARAIRIGTRASSTFGLAAAAMIPPPTPKSVHGDTFAQAASRFFVGRASQTAPVIRPALIKPAIHISLAFGICQSTAAITKHENAITATSGRLTSTFPESEFFGGDDDIPGLCRVEPAACQCVTGFADYQRSSRRSSGCSSANSSSSSRERSSSSFGTTI